MADHPYAYCMNDPINFHDPFGLERIVVAGGYYNNDTKKSYQYEFIDSALRELQSYSGDGSSEKTTLLVANKGYTKSDKKDIKWYGKYGFYTNRDDGFNIVYFKNTKQLRNYIERGDKKSNGTKANAKRINDPITKFRLYAHGYAGSIEFGHGLGLSDSQKKKLSWTRAKIKKLDKRAFKNTDSIFYSCNTATKPEKGNSFAYEWNKITGGTTKAIKGYSWYGDIHKDAPWHVWLSRKLSGGPYPAWNEPGITSGSSWVTFK